MTTAVTLNPTYARLYPADGIQYGTTYTAADNGSVPGQIVYTQVPGGCWAVKVRRRSDEWVALAVPRKGNTNAPFDIATSQHREAALMAGIGWANSASCAVMHPNRIVFAGFGDATEETPLSQDGAS